MNVLLGTFADHQSFPARAREEWPAGRHRQPSLGGLVLQLPPGSRRTAPRRPRRLALPHVTRANAAGGRTRRCLAFIPPIDTRWGGADAREGLAGRPARAIVAGINRGRRESSFLLPDRRSGQCGRPSSPESKDRAAVPPGFPAVCLGGGSRRPSGARGLGVSARFIKRSRSASSVSRGSGAPPRVQSWRRIVRVA